MTSLEQIENPKVKTVDSLFSDKIPEIIGIDYDLWTLRAILSFSIAEQIVEKRIYIIFKNIVGFRVLDEGNLLEFWNPDTRASGWLWEVEKGGWLDLEKLRHGFVEGYHENEYRKEFLVLGQNNCLSIITNSAPIIIDSEE